MATLKLEQSLSLKPKGWLRIDSDEGWTRITVNRPGRPPEMIRCFSPGHANRVRQELSDRGLTGLVEGSL